MKKMVLHISIILFIVTFTCVSFGGAANRPLLTKEVVQLKVNKKLQDEGYDLSRIYLDDIKFNSKTNIWVFLYWTRYDAHQIDFLIVTVSNDKKPKIRIIFEDEDEDGNEENESKSKKEARDGHKDEGKERRGDVQEVDSNSSKCTTLDKCENNGVSPRL